MKPAHTFDSVVMELVSGLRSGDITLETSAETVQSTAEREATESSAEFMQPLCRDGHRKSKGA
jgi:hypothetical protein